MGRFFKVILLFFFSLFFSTAGFTHETWILTQEQITNLNAEVKPEIFTSLTTTNVTISIIAILFVLMWVLLDKTGAKELFPTLQTRLSAQVEYVPFILRLAVGITLLIAALGINPHHARELFETSVLISPDMELNVLSAQSQQWIFILQVGLAIGLFLGIYTRLLAFICIILLLVGCLLFGTQQLDYGILVAAASIYLILQGAGKFCIPLPYPKFIKFITVWLQKQPRLRAQFLMRIISGIGFLYLAIFYKFMQPNLVLYIIVEHHVPTFGMEPTTFIFIMAIAELLIGIFMILGILMRVLGIFVIGAFLFFSFAIGEGLFAHAAGYGIMLSFFFNSGGQWRYPTAKDKAAKIVIIGSSLEAIHANLRLERLIGQYSNIELTTIHHNNSFTYTALLPEVMSGSIMAENAVFPLSRMFNNTKLISAQDIHINSHSQTVQAIDETGTELSVSYDYLIIAEEDYPDLNHAQGIMNHTEPAYTIGDVLHLRHCLIRMFELASLTSDIEKRQQYLTFYVIGGGEIGCAIAAELVLFIDAVRVEFPTIKPDEISITLTHNMSRILERHGQRITKKAHRILEKKGVRLHLNDSISMVTKNYIYFKSGEKVFCLLKINTVTKPSTVSNSLMGNCPSSKIKDRICKIQVNDYLQANRLGNIFAVGRSCHWSLNYPVSMWSRIRMARKAAYNSWALSQGYTPKKLKKDNLERFFLLSMGHNLSLINILGFPFFGLIPWIMTRIYSILSIPGLERNIRILFDFFLDIFFRNDTTILSLTRSSKVKHNYFGQEETIISEGDDATCAYIIKSGTVSCYKNIDGKQEFIRELYRGDLFGELALINESPRAVTVIAKTPVIVYKLTRDEFTELIEISKQFRDIIENTAQNRNYTRYQ